MEISSDALAGAPAVSAVPARLGTDAEFTAFVAAHYGRLLHVADLLVGDRNRAEDLLQTVLVRTYQRHAKAPPDNLLAYVRAGLANGRIDWWRRGWSRERPTDDVPASGVAPDHATEIAGRDAILRALAVLTARERAVEVLRFYEDLSELDTARTLGVAVGTVKSTCARALAKLRISPELEGHRHADH